MKTKLVLLLSLLVLAAGCLDVVQPGGPPGGGAPPGPGGGGPGDGGEQAPPSAPPLPEQEAVGEDKEPTVLPF